MGRKFITWILGTVPSRGRKQKWDRKKIQGVKWDLRNRWEGNHSRIEEENRWGITKMGYEERQKIFWKVCLLTMLQF